VDWQNTYTAVINVFHVRGAVQDLAQIEWSPTLPQGTGATATGASLTPVDGVREYLWIAMGFTDDNVDFIGGPSGWTNGPNVNAGGNEGPSAKAAHLVTTAATQTPGAFQLASSTGWTTITFAIPAAP
jgi:hypothetical protein